MAADRDAFHKLISAYLTKYEHTYPGGIPTVHAYK